MKINQRKFTVPAINKGEIYLRYKIVPNNLSKTGMKKFKEKWDQFHLEGKKIYHGRMQLLYPQHRKPLLEQLYAKSLRGRDALYETYIKGKYLGITKKFVNEFLQKQESHQVHQPKFKVKKVQPLVVRRPLVRWQMDLVDYKKKLYILTIIDTFSKYAYAFIIRYKKAKNIAGALAKVIGSDFYPSIIHTDNGTEFHGEFDELLKKYGIKHIRGSPYKSTSQAIIERFNKTLMGMLHKRFTFDKNEMLTDTKLQREVDEYNNTYHSTIKAKPADVHIFKRGEDYKKGTRTISKIIKKRASKVQASERQRVPKLIVGDKVRIALTSLQTKERKLAKAGFSKSYKRLWTYQTYTIAKVYRTTKKYMVPRYQVKIETGVVKDKLFLRDELLKIKY